MFYPRLILPRLEKELLTSEATVLTGMRRTGKTSILKYLFGLVESKNKAFFDFENPVHVNYFNLQDFDAVLPSLGKFGINSKEKAYIFIDEIQNLPIIARIIKYLHDHYETKFFVSGSSSYYLKNLFPESLAGRKLIFEIFPLTFSEFLIFKGLPTLTEESFLKKASNKFEANQIRMKEYFEEYVTYGGFPEVVLEPDFNRKKELLENTFKTYFENDVKTLLDLDDRGKLRDLIFLLAARVGSNVEINKLSSELAVSSEKIYSYLEFLEGTYFISLVPRFSRSVDRSRAGRRKLFFADCGLANYFGKLSSGHVLENAVFQTLRVNHKVAFFLKEGREIDFVVDDQIALEVKTAASKRDLYSLSVMSKNLGISEYYVVSKSWLDNPNVIMASEM